MLNRTNKPSDYMPQPAADATPVTTTTGSGSVTSSPSSPGYSGSNPGSGSGSSPASGGFRSAASDVVNVISKGTSITGDVVSDGEIRIDGRVKGTVTSKGKVVIGNDGVVEGDILCTNADILGTLAGTIKVSELLYLRASALVKGDVTTRQFQMEPTARFNGRCIMEVESLMTTLPDVKEKEKEKEREKDKKNGDAAHLFQKETV